jgi:predicted esterase
MLNKNLVKSEYIKPYYTLGKYTQKTKSIWFVFHGFGQLGVYFAKNFEDCVNDETYFIFPQGPSKFYVGFDFNRVGASWLTKNEVEDEIENVFGYLESILERENIDLNKVKINGFGFSQGVSVLVRWFAKKQFETEKLILWAGQTPKTFVDYEKFPLPKKIYFVAGNQDPLQEYMNLEDELGFIEKNLNTKPELISYEGGHKVDREIILELINRD